MELRFVYITTASREEALAIGRALVAARLAACTNVLHPMQSCYWWQGKLEEGAETVLIAKTRAGLVDNLVAKVKALHSHTVPCIVALPILAGNPDYLAWLDAETRPPVG
ncbi:MAG: divalent-cation tolerance protein CutA [Candidatus Lambdaproteobacteria bacterium]|nr:divalent-cation tolerance protein CutA [Candidatus Lambdaproteobacteria bacterium]